MVGLKNISAEFKSAALFGSVALFLSLLSGFAAGIEVGIVILRSLLLTLVFSALGYGVLFIIKKFVPEFYQVIKNLSGASQVDVNIDDESDEGTVTPEESINIEDNLGSGIKAGSSEAGTGAEAGVSAQKAGGAEFSELGDDYYPKMESTPSSDKVENGLNHELSAGSDQPKGPAGKKTQSLGKHIIMQDQFVRYEPKLMAEAVRTMIRKDD